MSRFPTVLYETATGWTVVQVSPKRYAVHTPKHDGCHIADVTEYLVDAICHAENADTLEDLPPEALTFLQSH